MARSCAASIAPAILVVASSLAASSASAAVPSRCAPLGGFDKAADTATATSATDVTTTEYLAQGSYRVSTCSKAGVLARSQTVTPVAVPVRRSCGDVAGELGRRQERDPST